jgi:hypothetical protein
LRPLGQAAIWGLANAVFYGLGAFSSYENSIPRDAPERWAWGTVAFGSALAAGTLAGWYVIRARQSTPIRAWRLGGVAASLAAALAHVPVFYWITARSYVWYMRANPGAPDYTVMTFLGGLLALPLLFGTVFLVVTAVSEGLFWLNRRRGREKAA